MADVFGTALALGFTSGMTIWAFSKAFEMFRAGLGIPERHVDITGD